MKFLLRFFEMPSASSIPILIVYLIGALLSGIVFFALVKTDVISVDEGSEQTQGINADAVPAIP